MNYIQDYVTKETNKWLEEEYMESEVIQAIQQMDFRKSLGVDGLSGSFFKQNWEIIGLFVKFNMSKVYDLVEWDFLEAVMLKGAVFNKPLEQFISSEGEVEGWGSLYNEARTVMGWGTLRLLGNLSNSLMQSGLAMSSERRSSGLALMWRKGLDVAIQSYFEHHIDSLVQLDNHSNIRVNAFKGIWRGRGGRENGRGGRGCSQEGHYEKEQSTQQNWRGSEVVEEAVG
ncbi:hypothetical protein GOBAR_AA09093 [Gossypium barbadense]|uniref:Uncharacterized protein n=1 Tax=Gossypium barbadense TaxID=3634 RepID=A0A2P5Y7G5_GOSBA|nr:hypothetical protein GOBAR_AA09093 [Gossypium barbadense]